MLPGALTEALGAAGFPVDDARPVGGGDISDAYRLTLHDGTAAFLKVHPSDNGAMFCAEADGLQRMQAVGIIVPEVLHQLDRTDAHPAALLMRWVEPTRQGRDEATIGRTLARLHHASTSDACGLETDNFIGSLPQSNRPTDDWSTFFVNERLRPQVTLANQRGLLNRRLLDEFETLGEKADQILVAPPGGPSLLHGDMWGGNQIVTGDGTVVLIDPAVFYGHPEYDLAFTELFGSFSRRFFDGYAEVMPLQEGYEVRRPMYQLYPWLVHLNLFGGMYLSQVTASLHDCLRQV